MKREEIIRSIQLFWSPKKRDRKVSDMILEDYKKNGRESVMSNLQFYLEQTGFYRTSHTIGEIIRGTEDKKCTCTSI